MKVIFIKDHPVGIKEGRVIDTNPDTAKRWIEEGYVKEVTEEVKEKPNIDEPIRNQHKQMKLINVFIKVISFF